MHPDEFLENSIKRLICRDRFGPLDVNLYELFKDDFDFIEGRATHFDFFGYRKTEEKVQKLLLDVKTTGSRNRTAKLHETQKGVVEEAQEKDYEVYVGKVILLEDWDIKVEVKRVGAPLSSREELLNYLAKSKILPVKRTENGEVEFYFRRQEKSQSGKYVTGVRPRFEEILGLEDSNYKKIRGEIEERI